MISIMYRRGPPPSGADSAPRFPDIPDQHTGQKVVGRANPLEHGVAGERDDDAADELVTVFDRRGRRIGQDEKREVQDRVQIGRPKDLCDAPDRP